MRGNHERVQGGWKNFEIKDPECDFIRIHQELAGAPGVWMEKAWGPRQVSQTDTIQQAVQGSALPIIAHAEFGASPKRFSL